MIKHIISRLIPLVVFVLILLNFTKLASILEVHSLLYIIITIYAIANIWWIIDMIIKYRRNEAGKCIFNLILIIIPILYWKYEGYL